MTNVKKNETATEVKTVAAKEVKATAAKTAAKKPATKKTTAKNASAQKSPTQKAPAQKALSTTVTFQFDGKSYTPDTLVQIAKDVWKYDLNKDVSELESVEIYVKPEDSAAYYVFNKSIDGSFLI